MSVLLIMDLGKFVAKTAMPLPGIFTLMRKICTAYEYLQVSPVKRRYKPKVRKEMRSFLNPVDARKLLHFSKDKPLGLAIWIGLLSTLRPSEIQALTVGALNFSRQVIIIKSAHKRKVKRIEPYPKQSD